MTKLILFLLRIKFGLKENEPFQFSNQKNIMDYYYWTSSGLKKKMIRKCETKERKANVSLNWLLDPECKIVKIK